MAESAWTVRLSGAAEAGLCRILRWTADKFGSTQARAYADTLSSALKALCAGPTLIGVRERPEVGNNLWTLHVARNGRKGRHFIMFRVTGGQNGKVIDVLRLLYDSMDLERHLPSSG